MNSVATTSATDRSWFHHETINALIHDSGEMNGWQCLHPESWSESDVLDFIFSLDDVSLQTLRGERFCGLTGLDLCRLTVDEFVVRDQLHGQLIYRRLHSLLRQRNCGTIPLGDNSDRLQTSACWSISSLQQQPVQIPQPVCNLLEDEYYSGSGEWSVDGVLWSASSRYLDHGGCVVDNSASLPATSQLVRLRTFADHPLPSSELVFTDLLNVTDAVVDDDVSLRHFQSLQQDRDDQSQRRQPAVCTGRRRKDHAQPRDTKSPEIRGPEKPKRRQNRTGGHLWEFIRRLLSRTDADGERIIQWENKSEGVFRFLNPDAVAELWGKQKHNRRTAMDYPKLSRALRWCQSYGYLAKLPKDSGYPRKLCFQFGPMAVNWRDGL